MSESIRSTLFIDKAARKPFIYRHVVSFEETNLVGNVYFARHIAWQGRCREMFLRKHAPEIMDELKGELRLITLKASCEYFDEVFALDSIAINMYLASVVSNRISMKFEYDVVRQSSITRFATGSQDLACMKLIGFELVPTSIPNCLKQALQNFN